MRLWLSFSLLLFVLMHPSLPAQQLGFQHISVDEGLPASTVWWVTQDQKGFVWFATASGAARYDGHAFQYYNKGNGLTDNEIFHIYPTQDGKLWFLPFFDKLNWLAGDEIHVFEDGLGLDKIVVNMMAEDDSGDRWVSTVKGLAHFPAGAGEEQRMITKLQAEDVHFPHFKAYNFFKDISGQLYCMTDCGILAIAPEFKLHPYPKQERVLNPRGCLLKSGGVLYANSEGLALFQRGKHRQLLKLESLKTASGRLPIVNRIFQDSDGFVWVGSSEGLFQFEDGRLESRHMRLHLPGVKISCLMEDHERNLWASTQADGVYFLTRNAIHVRNYGIAEGLSGRKVTAMAQSGGELWLGHENGSLSCFHKGKVRSTWQQPTTPHSSKVRALAFGPGDVLWAASDDGLYWWGENGDFHRLELSVNKNLSFDREGNMYIGNGAFWVQIPLEEQENFRAFFDPGLPRRALEEKKAFFKAFPHAWRRTYAIHADHCGQIWTGNTKGLYRADHGANALSEVAVNDIRSGACGRTFVATSGMGMLVFDGDRPHIYGKNEGLASDICHQSLEQNDSVLWVATNSGLSRMTFSQHDPGKPFIENFHQADGIASNEVTSLALHRDTLFIGSLNGLSLFPISKIHSNTLPPRIFLRKLRIWDQSIPIEREMRLSPSQNDLTISFTGISFRSGPQLSYMYRLKGLDDHWQHSSQTSVRYPPLPSGQYRFEVFAINENGVPSLSPAILDFTITTPIWKRTWFLLLSFLLLLALGYWAVATRIRRIRQGEALHRQLLESEQNALRAQMNPHFIFNALNSIQRFIAQNDKKEAGIYLAKFAQLIRATLDHSRKSQISLHEELRSLQLYLELECLRFKDRLSHRIDCAPGLDTEGIRIPSMLIQPYVENAVKHAFNKPGIHGSIFIQISESGHKLKVVVEDDGIGIEAGGGNGKIKISGGGSLGTTVTHERLELLNQTSKEQIAVRLIDLSTREGRSGTRVELDIPIFHNS